MTKQNFETLAIHAGYNPFDSENSRAVPIHRTTAYMFESSEHARKLFALETLGNIYTRLGNPTQQILEDRIAILEKGKAAVALASGTSAIHYTVLNICRVGDEIASSNQIYGGTYTMFSRILPQCGIKVNFFDPSDEESIEKAITQKTRLIFTETVSNPSLEVPDFDMFSRIAKKHSLPLVVDSTFTTPYLLNPVDYGADVIIHSLTKWIGGHGTGIGGIVVDAGTFDWKNEKFENFNIPDESYHGIRFAHDLGALNEIAFAIRMRVVPLRNLGACISPDNAWLFLQGLETLSLRMERHSENAMKVSGFLNSHSNVAWVKYPGLENDKSSLIAAKYLKKGFGGMVVFGIKGGKEAGEKFIDSLKLISHLANVGDAKTLAIHPASTTHSQLSEKELEQSRIGEDMIRLSVGIENIDDIIGDISQALEKSCQ